MMKTTTTTTPRVTSKYFREDEFRRCTPPCSLQDMDQEFITLLDALRAEAGIPLTLNCAYRSPEYERSKGRSESGDHPQGRGVDIRCITSDHRYLILRAAFKLGVTRIGIAGSFVHIGSGRDLPQRVVWGY